MEKKKFRNEIVINIMVNVSNLRTKIYTDTKLCYRFLLEGLSIADQLGRPMVWGSHLRNNRYLQVMGSHRQVLNGRVTGQVLI